MEEAEQAIMEINDEISYLEEQRTRHEAKYRTYVHMYSYKLTKEKN